MRCFFHEGSMHHHQSQREPGSAINRTTAITDQLRYIDICKTLEVIPGGSIEGYAKPRCPGRGVGRAGSPRTGQQRHSGRAASRPARPSGSRPGSRKTADRQARHRVHRYPSSSVRAARRPPCRRLSPAAGQPRRPISRHPVKQVLHKPQRLHPIRINRGLFADFLVVQALQNAKDALYPSAATQITQL